MELKCGVAFRHLHEALETYFSSSGNHGWRPCPYLGYPEFKFKNGVYLRYNLFSRNINLHSSDTEKKQEILDNLLPLLEELRAKEAESLETEKNYGN